MGVGGQHFGGAVVDERVAAPHRHARVGLGDHRRAGRRRRYSDHGRLGVGDVVAAVGAHRGQAQLSQPIGQLGAGDAHHGASGRVEAHGRGDGEFARRSGSPHRGLHLVEVAHRLDPQHIRASSGQPGRLLGERGLARRLRHVAHRLQELAGRAHRAGHQHNTARPLGLGVSFHAGVAGRSLVELHRPVLQAVEGQTEAGPAEAVGHHQVGPGLQVGPMDGPNLIGVGHVPFLGRIARAEAHREELGAHGSVGHHVTVGCQEFIHGDGHGFRSDISQHPLVMPWPRADQRLPR